MILAAAAKCIASSSLLDFTMSAISKEAGLSMGSIYKHIQSKEDVLVALATKMYENTLCRFQQILSLPVPHAVRFIGLQMIDADKACLYCFDDYLEMLVANEAILQRASDRWVEKMIEVDIAIEKQCSAAFSSAIEAGELKVSDDKRKKMVEEIVVGCWSLHVGFIQVARQRHVRQLADKGAKMPFPLQVSDSIVQAQKNLLNTYPWAQPITDADIHHVCELMVEKGLR